MDARALLVVLAACSSPSVSIQVTTGGETDALTKAPAVDTVVVEEVFPTGTSVKLDQAPLPQVNIDLGNPSQADYASIQVTGLAQGTPVVTGSTPFVTLGALNGATVPLLVQREGECARMPSPMADGRTAPLVAPLSTAVVVAGGELPDGGAPIVDGYDFLFLQESTVLGPFSDVRSFATQTLAQVNNDGASAYAYLIHEDSADIIELGVNLEFGDGGAQPTTFAWSDVSGGVTVVGADGNPYLVGAGRLGPAPSNVFAQLPSDGLLHPGNTSFRQGAAVAATSAGIVLYGGNARASDPGAEIIDTDLTLHAFTQYPSDATEGLAAVAFDAHRVLVSPAPRDVTHRMRLLDLQCSGCSELAAWGPPDVPILSPQALFQAPSGPFILVGDDASGATHVFRIDAASVREMPLKIPRQGARAVQSPTGAVVIVGGGSPTLESCVP